MDPLTDSSLSGAESPLPLSDLASVQSISAPAKFQVRMVLPVEIDHSVQALVRVLPPHVGLKTIEMISTLEAWSVETWSSTKSCFTVELDGGMGSITFVRTSAFKSCSEAERVCILSSDAFDSVINTCESDFVDASGETEVEKTERLRLVTWLDQDENIPEHLSVLDVVEILVEARHSDEILVLHGTAFFVVPKTIAHRQASLFSLKRSTPLTSEVTEA